MQYAPYNLTQVVVFGGTKPTGVQYYSIIVGLAMPNVKMKPTMYHKATKIGEIR
jgi:hypothetical protein